MNKWNHNINDSLIVKYNLNPDDYTSYSEWRNACKRANERLHGGMKSRYIKMRDSIKRNANKWKTNNRNRIKQQRQEQYKGIDTFKGVSKNERFCGVVLKEYFGDSYIQQCFCITLSDQDRKDWDLTSRKIYVDYWVADKNLIVEYDGPHHYGIDMYYVRDKSFIEHTKKRDLFLANYCKINGIQLIRVNGVSHKKPAQIRRVLVSLLGTVSHCDSTMM